MRTMQNHLYIRHAIRLDIAAVHHRISHIIQFPTLHIPSLVTQNKPYSPYATPQY
jgi:hypothetical protein